MHNRIVVAFLAAFCMSVAARAADDVTLTSPDGKVLFRLSMGSKGNLEYAVSLNQKPVIEASAIGITVDGVNLAAGAQIGKSDTYRVNETYPWYGVHSRPSTIAAARGSR